MNGSIFFGLFLARKKPWKHHPRNLPSRWINLEILQLKVGVGLNTTTTDLPQHSKSPLPPAGKTPACAQTPDDVWSHASIYTYLSPPLWSSVSVRCAFLEGSLHLFSRCGDRSCWQSLVAAFTHDPLGQARNTAAALIAFHCAVPCVDFHLSTNAPTSVNTAEGKGPNTGPPQSNHLSS